MGKSFSTHRIPLFEMTAQPFPTSPEDTDPRLLEALRILNQISNAINRIGSDDATHDDLSLQLIVESAIRVVPGSSAVIYTYDQSTGEFEKESRVSAEPEGRKPISALNQPDDAPRPNGMGCERSSVAIEVFPTKNPI